MRSSSDQDFLQSVLYEVIGKKVKLIGASVISGGCINNALKVQTSAGAFFLKWHDSIPPDMFEKEAMGLDLLHESGSVRVPHVIGYGNTGGRYYLLMEYLEGAQQSGAYWENLGRSLGEMHRNVRSDRYGLEHNNYIGRLPQRNRWHNDWLTFFIEERLEVQLQMAIEQRQVDATFAARYRAFYKKLPDLLSKDPPSLLHGDLWSGNVMTGPAGQACLIDPAVYYGHREIELSFTKMFGGFGGEFYTAYQEVWPLTPGFDSRIDIYNIYPSMVHVNLFGGAYLDGVERVLRRYQ
jgi:fructosamine-3-kinase